MTIFSVHHTTTYRYKTAVRPGLHHMMFRPRDSFDQRLLECSLRVTPEPAEIRWIHDVFGNCITLVDFKSKTTELSFETLIRLDHSPENTPDFRIEDYARAHPLRKSFPILRPIFPGTIRVIQASNIGLASSSHLARRGQPGSS
jgi:Bacterial transglutaminase-like N-terminal region